VLIPETATFEPGFAPLVDQIDRARLRYLGHLLP